MSATMDKKDVLYRVAYKDASSIKWGTITKLAGKEAPQDVKNEVLRLLNDKKNNKMEAKLGMIRKGDKIELLLRIKNGSKHIYDKVLMKDFIPPNESVLESNDGLQDERFKKATKEIDEVFAETEKLEKIVKLLSEKLDSEEEEHGKVIQKVENVKMTTALFVNLATACRKRTTTATEIGEKANQALAKHKQDISAFRGGGAARLGGKHQLQEDRIDQLTPRFAKHSNYLGTVEQEVNLFKLRVKQFTNTVTGDLKRLDNNVDKMTALSEYLNNNLTAWTELRNTQQNVMGKGMTSYLDYNTKEYPLSIVETGISFVEAKVDSFPKVFAKAKNQIETTLKKLPQIALQNTEVAKKVEEIEKFKTAWELEIKQYVVDAKKALEHMKKVKQEFANNEKN